MTKPKFIVGEVSKNWRGGWHHDEQDKLLLCQKFETLINYNLEYGYELHSFQLHRVTNDGVMNETIVAVFKESD